MIGIGCGGTWSVARRRGRLEVAMELAGPLPGKPPRRLMAPRRREVVVGPGAPVTLAELSQLWWFADGAIMAVDTRAHLHRSWGLCARHAWLYFRVETALRVDPLGNAVLTADLVHRAAGIVTARGPLSRRLDRLRTRDSCFTCDHGGHGAQRFVGQLVQVNASDAPTRWCDSCRSVWQPRICPRCVPEADGSTDTRCRTHLLGAAGPEGLPRSYLQDLAGRLDRCVRSMTADGPARTPDTDAALVEGIGWVAGWRPELVL